MEGYKETSKHYELDIGDIVDHFKELKRLSKPIIDTKIFVTKVFLSCSSNYSLECLWLSWFFICIMPSGTIMISMEICFFFSIAIGIWQYYNRINLKLYPSKENNTNKVIGHYSHVPETIDEFKACLHKIDTIMLNACNLLESIYGFLRWDNPILSLKITLCFSAITYCNFTFSFQYTVLLILSVLSLSRYFGNYGTHDKSHDVQIKYDNFQSCDQHTKETSYDGVDFIPNNSFVDLKNDFSNSMPLSRDKFSKSRRCHFCESKLSYLKPCHTCVYCAQTFCQKCCSLEVPKSVLGVTAPETCNDLVLICFTCHCNLYSSK